MDTDKQTYEGQKETDNGTHAAKALNSEWVKSSKLEKVISHFK